MRREAPPKGGELGTASVRMLVANDESVYVVDGVDLSSKSGARLTVWGLAVFNLSGFKRCKHKSIQL